MTKTSPKPHRFDLQHLDDNYRVETKNLFQELLVTEEETTPNELWLGIKDSFLRAATKHVPKKGKRKTTSWLSQDAINLADHSFIHSLIYLFPLLKNIQSNDTSMMEEVQLKAKPEDVASLLKTRKIDKRN